MTPNTMQNQPTIQRSITELMQLPAFQNLLAKIETNFYRNRPSEAKTMETDGSLPSFLQEQAKQAWETLSTARSMGTPMVQAEELIADIVYPSLETESDSL